ncbi:MAG TPA: hypothetical protein VME21_14135 [Steroidobacteraceae bacterium]|nr:hypothetical protein [Steroidobacteraceae bacterium]
MIDRTPLYASLIALLTTLPARADCVLPPAPSKVPDGTSASEQEMLSAMQTLKQYDGDVNIYLKCLEFEEKQMRLSSGERETKHNTAVAQLEKVASKFNEQVRVYKSKHG